MNEKQRDYVKQSAEKGRDKDLLMKRGDALLVLALMELVDEVKAIKEVLKGEHLR